MRMARCSLVGMLMRSLRVPVGLLAVIVSRCGVILGLVVLTHRMVVRRLVMMMSRSAVMSGGIMVVLTRGMFVLVGHNRSPDWL
jgi:hypothetical protein